MVFLLAFIGVFSLGIKYKSKEMDLVDWTEYDILPLIQPTKEFIETIKNLIKS